MSTLTENLRRLLEVDDAEEGELNSADLETVAEAIEELRMMLLFGVEDSGFSPFTSTAFLKGISYLSIAHECFNEAQMHQANAIEISRRLRQGG